MDKKFNFDEQLIIDALEYHEYPTPGKIQVVPVKPVATQRDLSLAYSPGVAIPCLKIADNESCAYQYTNKGNLVAVISNGTAVLGLGNIGALAGKPVMEGKAVLFKRFAGIDVFDIEINETNVDKLVDIIASLEPTFGGINLEDIKAPECFELESRLQARLKIPVFHDDQHGTAIVVAAAVINGLFLVKKDIQAVKMFISGAGAAAIACADLLVSLGIKHNNIYMADSKGLIHESRKDSLDASKKRYCQSGGVTTIMDAITNADIFLGVSGAGTADQEMVKAMAKDPLIFVLANPTPEIMPELIHAVRQDAIVATGRSDYPNQVNNAVCFPYIFRGALDVGATCINSQMKIAAVMAIADLARQEPIELVSSAYCGSEMKFGVNYIIPKPLDHRLIKVIAPAVARAAIETNVATHTINIDEYIESLDQYIYKSNMFMRPVFNTAKHSSKKIILCEGEDERVLRAAKEILDLKLAQIILVGRPAVIERRINNLGIRLDINNDVEVINNESDARFKEFWQCYYDAGKRFGITPETAKREITRNTTLIGCTALNLGLADGMICGTFGGFYDHFKTIETAVGYNNSQGIAGAMNALVLPFGNLFIVDTCVNRDPSVEQLVFIIENAVNVIQKFGIAPKVALLSHSNFGSDMNSKTALKMREVLKVMRDKFPTLEIDGEMQGDTALVDNIREKIMPDSHLKGSANLLVMPNIESANIAYNLLRVSSPSGVTIGPILMGIKRPVHIVSNVSSVRRIVNMTALLVTQLMNTNA